MKITEEQLLEYIKRDHVTFAELGQRWPEDFRDGLRAIELGRQNVFVWLGMSSHAVNLVMRLRAEGRLHFMPTDSLTYMIDGIVPKFPIAKRPPKNGYKKEHWMPAVIRPGQAPEGWRQDGGPRCSTNS